jgi:hypothetical protein
MSPPAIGSQVQDQGLIPPVEDPKSCISLTNPYINPPVCLPVVNKVANIKHPPEDRPIRDCYGWDPMLDGEEDDSNSDQDSAMPDELQGKISGNTWRMMDQQFAQFTHASEGKDFMGSEDTLNDVFRQIGDMVVGRSTTPLYLSILHVSVNRAPLPN